MFIQLLWQRRVCVCTHDAVRVGNLGAEVVGGEHQDVERFGRCAGQHAEPAQQQRPHGHRTGAVGPGIGSAAAAAAAGQLDYTCIFAAADHEGG